MIWRSETIGDWKTRLSQWHRWFAWWPVFCEKDRATAWLRHVERRLVAYGAYSDHAVWEHRLI